VSRRRPPGFGLTLGITLTVVGLIVLLPLLALVGTAASTSLSSSTSLWQQLLTPRALSALRVSLTTAFGAALVNAVFGFITAWVLHRVRFPGRALLDAVVDLPFALPTAVAGLALCALYAKTGPLGAVLQRVGVDVAYTPLGIGVALVFVGLPFVVRTLQPALEQLDPHLEEAALSLGASRLQVFVRVVLPPLLPAWLTGFTLAFARGVGEYGSVVFIAGNMPLHTEIVPLLIVTALEEYNVPGAVALSTALLLVSAALLLASNLLQRISARALGQA
jgi:sulfate transport system permease protein